MFLFFGRIIKAFLFWRCPLTQVAKVVLQKSKFAGRHPTFFLGRRCFGFISLRIDSPWLSFARYLSLRAGSDTRLHSWGPKPLSSSEPFFSFCHAWWCIHAMRWFGVCFWCTWMKWNAFAWSRRFFGHRLISNHENPLTQKAFDSRRWRLVALKPRCSIFSSRGWKPLVDEIHYIEGPMIAE